MSAGTGAVDAREVDVREVDVPLASDPFVPDPFTRDLFDPADPFTRDPFGADPFGSDPFGSGEPIDWLDRPERASLADRTRELVRARVGRALGGGLLDRAPMPAVVVVSLTIVVGLLVLGLLVVGALVVPRVLGGGAHGATATARSGTAMAGIDTSGTLPLADGVPSSSGAGASSPAVALDGLPVVTVASPPATTVMIRVHVAGAVARPGVYSLSSDARVIDAARLAGGTTAELDPDAVNLAAPVADGARVFLPRRGRAVPAVAPSAGSGPGSVGPASVGPASVVGAGATSTGAPSSGPVSVNTASADELDGLPGIGPALAQRIVEFRTAHGGFRSVDQLLDVPGIGDAKLASLRSKVRV